MFTPAAEVTALQQAVDNNAPKDEIKAKLQALQAKLKDDDAKLQAARDDLRSLLSPKQEAVLVLQGYPELNFQPLLESISWGGRERRRH